MAYSYSTYLGNNVLGKNLYFGTKMLIIHIRNFFQCFTSSQEQKVLQVQKASSSQFLKRKKGFLLWQLFKNGELGYLSYKRHFLYESYLSSQSCFFLSHTHHMHSDLNEFETAFAKFQLCVSFFYQYLFSYLWGLCNSSIWIHIYWTTITNLTGSFSSFFFQF